MLQHFFLLFRVVIIPIITIVMIFVVIITIITIVMIIWGGSESGEKPSRTAPEDFRIHLADLLDLAPVQNIVLKHKIEILLHIARVRVRYHRRKNQIHVPHLLLRYSQV